MRHLCTVKEGDEFGLVSLCRLPLHHDGDHVFLLTPETLRPIPANIEKLFTEEADHKLAKYLGGFFRYYRRNKECTFLHDDSVCMKLLNKLQHYTLSAGNEGHQIELYALPVQQGPFVRDYVEVGDYASNCLPLHQTQFYKKANHAIVEASLAIIEWQQFLSQIDFTSWDSYEELE